jgi:thiol:disulfide interchange protein DsbD
MKAIILIGLSLITGSLAVAQSNKQVSWAWSAKKIADRTYEVHMTATIGGDFHLYAQDAVAKVRLRPRLRLAKVRS